MCVKIFKPKEQFWGTSALQKVEWIKKSTVFKQLKTKMIRNLQCGNHKVIFLDIFILSVAPILKYLLLLFPYIYVLHCYPLAEALKTKDQPPKSVLGL